MGSLSAVIVAATVLRSHVPQGASLEARCRTAIRAALAPDNGATFMCANDDEVFRSAIAAVLMTGCPIEEREQIEYTLSLLRGVGAASQGVPVDFGLMIREDMQPLPLLGWWHEEKAREAR